MSEKIDTRLRHADRLRQTLSRNHAVSWGTRQRMQTALKRYEETAGPTTDSPAAIVLDGLIGIGEICADPDAKRCPAPDWVLAAIERHLQQNQDL